MLLATITSLFRLISPFAICRLELICKRVAKLRADAFDSRLLSDIGGHLEKCIYVFG